MRQVTRFGLFAAALVLAASAQAETRIFIVANNSDGYGVDRCLATGATCGSAVAAAYCHARDFSEARSYRRVEQAEVTGAAPPDEACRIGCDGYVAIECTR
jgi:hypothetical protein